MKRFPEGHIPQHAPIPERQYNTIKLKQTEWGKSTFARVVTIVSKQLMNIRLNRLVEGGQSTITQTRMHLYFYVVFIRYS